MQNGYSSFLDNWEDEIVLKIFVVMISFELSIQVVSR